MLQSFVARSALVPLQSAAIPETALSVDSLLLCQHKQIVIQPVHVTFPVLLFWARVQPVHHQLVGHSRTQVLRQSHIRVAHKLTTVKLQKRQLVRVFLAHMKRYQASVSDEPVA